MSNTEQEQHCNVLRLDLKTWESKFSARNGGRKAGRDDIKADAVISQKYKEYEKLRRAIAAKDAPGTPSRKAESQRVTRNVDRTPKRPKTVALTTPKRKREDSGIAEEDLTLQSYLLSPEGPAFIGPTPQRDGIAIGLFDLLPAETPSRRGALADMELNVVQTPSRNAGRADSETSLESRARGEKTPQSTGKRFLLDSFLSVTPNKRKLGEATTPSSRGLATPAFLRRHNPLTKIDEDDEPASRPAPWARRSFGRSLSARIQAMRQEEETRLDEEADIMRELEMEAEGMPAPKRIKVPEIQVKDSQAAMPLGPDRGLETEDDEDGEESELGPDGRPKRVWKKKGLKRQTRRVIMRPNFIKAKPQPEVQHDESDDEAKVAETQIHIQLDSSDDDGSDYASDASHSTKKRKTQQPKPKVASTSQAKEDSKNKEGPVKAAARKIKPWAHANYKRLKIKSKGGNGGKGRFGRKR
ncbi:regulatory particle non-ATPase [Didymosphaeria variabile]|uniref:DNA replication regulator SLD2 n=1 Tax=Didymosphaeria variabile TaxID=1932322 RepID=A0A9W8XE91_9PLEO|nr:regulatory particle non-ATPase [Didymosphaeria variabile]KAJ4347192.1 regulatory particle non-ATPase [Didymosphaeria variabile]